jgi:hypothetical protein
MGYSHRHLSVRVKADDEPLDEGPEQSPVVLATFTIDTI